MSQSPFIISASPLLLPNLRARALQPRETNFSFHGIYSLEFKMDVLTKKRPRGEVRTVVHGCSGHWGLPALGLKAAGKFGLAAKGARCLRSRTNIKDHRHRLNGSQAVGRDGIKIQGKCNNQS